MTTQGKLKPSESQVKEEGTLYHLEKKYFVHKTSTDLKKTVALISGIDIHDMIVTFLCKFPFPW